MYDYYGFFIVGVTVLIIVISGIYTVVIKPLRDKAFYRRIEKRKEASIPSVVKKAYEILELPLGASIQEIDARRKLFIELEKAGGEGPANIAAGLGEKANVAMDIILASMGLDRTKI